METVMASEKTLPFTPEALVAALSRNTTHVAIETIDGRSWTRREIAEHVSRYVQVLQHAGVTRRSKIAYLSNNSPEIIFVSFAGLMTDCCLVPLHPLGSNSDHAFIIEDAEADVLIFAPEFEAHASMIIAGAPRLRHIFSLGPSTYGEDLIRLSRDREAQSLVAPDVKGDDISRLSYTGGTTGRPKGVMVPYDSFRHMLAIQLSEWEWPAQIRHLVCAPLSHAGASAVLPTLILGGTLVVVPKFEAALVLATIEKFNITSTLLVPSMISALLRHDRGADLSSLRTVFYGGSSMPRDQLLLAIGRFGPVFSQFYAQAEAPMVVSLLRKDEHDPDVPFRLESCGRPLPGIQVRLVDPEGVAVTNGNPGELCVRGPIVAAGYWRREAETADVFRDGWLHTGDIAVQDDGGFLRIVDRKKDMIISGGFNIYCREVEDALTSHPSVSAAAVIGVPDPTWGEAVKAFVVLRDESSAITWPELTAHVRKIKGPACAPKIIEFAEEIPLTGLGKPDKALLRKRSMPAKV
jgi:fatty-acyl-CoA synthase